VEKPEIKFSRLNSRRSKKRRAQLFEKQNGLCFYCGRPMTKVKHKGDGNPKNSSLTLEHIIPLEDGGTNRLENLAASCYDCNNKKHRRRMQEKQAWGAK
jgi:5-methylcytosine-specific restriction endonuclease McrA